MICDNCKKETNFISYPENSAGWCRSCTANQFVQVKKEDFLELKDIAETNRAIFHNSAISNKILLIVSKYLGEKAGGK